MHTLKSYFHHHSMNTAIDQQFMCVPLPKLNSLFLLSSLFQACLISIKNEWSSNGYILPGQADKQATSTT